MDKQKGREACCPDVAIISIYFVDGLLGCKIVYLYQWFMVQIFMFRFCNKKYITIPSVFDTLFEDFSLPISSFKLWEKKQRVYWTVELQVVLWVAYAWATVLGTWENLKSISSIIVPGSLNLSLVINIIPLSLSLCSPCYS